MCLYAAASAVAVGHGGAYSWVAELAPAPLWRLGWPPPPIA